MITKAPRGTKWSKSLIHKGAQRVTKDRKGTKDHTVPQTYTEPYPTIPFPNHTLYSREDPRPLVTAGSAIMIVVHSVEVSTLYPRIVISSLAKWLENLFFAILYTSFGVWHIDHYMPLQRSTTGVCHALLRFPEQTVPTCCAKVSHTNVPSCSMWFRQFIKYVTKYNHKVWCHPHSKEHDTHPIAYLISKQAIPYQTRGGTCYPGVSTPKIRSLVGS
jgi:hypothetical protein